MISSRLFLIKFYTLGDFITRRGYHIFATLFTFKLLIVKFHAVYTAYCNEKITNKTNQMHYYNLILRKLIQMLTEFIPLTTKLLPQLYKCSILYVKGKAIPLQAWTDPDGSRRLRISDFKTVGT